MRVGRAIICECVVLSALGCAATLPVSAAQAITYEENPGLECILEKRATQLIGEHTTPVSPAEGATAQVASPVTFVGESGGPALNFEIASSPALLSSPDIDAGPGTLDPGTHIYTFPSTKATATPRTLYWAASFTRTQQGCPSPLVTYTTPARTLTVLPASSTMSPAPTTASTAEIAALLVGRLAPPGMAAKITALLKGGIRISFDALEAGVATIAWYYLPPGAKLAKSTKPVLVASGQLRFSAAGTAPIKVKPTAAGRRLLTHAGRGKLTAKGTFTPTGMTPITATRPFVLRR